MPAEITAKKTRTSRPIWFVRTGGLDDAGLDAKAIAWARANGFEGQAGKLLLLADAAGTVSGALFGIGKGETPLVSGKLATGLPEGAWHIAGTTDDPELVALGFLLGGYKFTRYLKKDTKIVSLATPEGAGKAEVRRLARAVTLARDLINTPTNDMGPVALEKEAEALAGQHDAAISVVKGAALLKKNLPMIHAVGRAGAEEPRLIDLRWGKRDAPKVTLVGKGVCFDTGGLDIKPASSMLLMKKDMGGAANVLALAGIIMDSGLPVRLRVLIPAVENAISANAFRPGDVLTSRKGLTVEIGNTDAEGRLVLADALALADEEEPELLIDMATLTGAARVALGPDLPPFYTNDDGFAAAMAEASSAVADPVWRMPLWQPYESKLSSRIADLNNVTTDGFAGSITAALFLQRFVSKARVWAHFDIFGWNPVEKPHAPIGGEAQAIRALYHHLKQRFAQ
ncbi:leucyl aminopeptidase family protein [Phyllobacterium sp. 0TCS1.6C]|uniref:leucyl aminopeptidase family protein n=1 Tax=unclassified Phyllobacterium TaxID=2638441 RepID=UPI002264353E|nr:MULTISPECIES: leucyl aminopeptidase family protein [unclassified Phyllobacterium]MCX8281858.1 leucyl aminopeptidase family protein [Phyllobacterium sp. 0TCS1.6C]MCX8295393.1 leucyl aminopeptidase family protein [Phyllobacterium sp. 0TCS1.6A]